MYELYLATGGTVVEERLSTERFLALNSNCIINCAGAWTTQLFEDPVPCKVIRGHLVHADIRKFPRTPNGLTSSYNYTPPPEVYGQANGQSSDVYCYPRLDCWILGGSRQEGEPNIGGEWLGEETVGETTTIGGVDVPKPIIDVNADILQQLTGVDIRKATKSVNIGYRFSRDPIRTEISNERGRAVLHNYGHGGSGITLSWGSAAKMRTLIAEDLGIKPQWKNSAAIHSGRQYLASHLSDLAVSSEGSFSRLPERLIANV